MNVVHLIDSSSSRRFLTVAEIDIRFREIIEELCFMFQRVR